MQYNKMKVLTTFNNGHKHFAFYDQFGEGNTSEPMDNKENPIESKDQHTHEIIAFKVAESENHIHGIDEVE
jgi:hypothetical protein